MKTRTHFICFAACSLFSLQVLGAPIQDQPPLFTPDFTTAEWSVASRSAHENGWEATVQITNEITRELIEHRQSFVELATGLNYRRFSWLPREISRVW